MTTYEQVKTGILSLSDSDQKRIITDVIPQIWPKACKDDVCLARMREIVDEETVKQYRDQNMGGI